jgi:hypothetical protein
VCQRQRPQPEVGGRVRDRPQAELDRVDRLEPGLPDDIVSSQKS